MESKKSPKCIFCKTEFTGRTDKIFCSVKCKSTYHHTLRRVSKSAFAEVDKILHRNRNILLEVMGKNRKQLKVDRILLEKKNFHFNYITGYYINSRKKVYHYVYDFSWMEFSDHQILINRKTK